MLPKALWGVRMRETLERDGLQIITPHILSVAIGEGRGFAGVKSIVSCVDRLNGDLTHSQIPTGLTPSSPF